MTSLVEQNFKNICIALVLLYAITMMTACATTDSPEPAVAPDKTDTRRNGQPRPEYGEITRNDGSTYKGFVNNSGEPHGFGRHYSADGVYVGNFKDGVKHGEGLLFLKKGGTWRMTFENGKCTGREFLGKDQCDDIDKEVSQ